jgi:hypothetical protein
MESHFVVFHCHPIRHEEALRAFEADKFEPAPRLTADDQSNNRVSLQRHLDQKLYLIVHSKQHNTWMFPQTHHTSLDSLRLVRVET